MSLVQDPSGAPAANTTDAVTPVFTGKNALIVAVAGAALPAGAATAANQTTEITSLQLLDDVPSAMNAAFSKANPVAGQLDDAATIAATEDNVAPVRITPQRAFHINLRNQAGTEVGTAAAPVRVDPTGTTTQPISAVALPLPTGAATAALQTQPGVDIGDVTVNNAAGAGAVNVQDGGNSLTVDTLQLPAALVGGRLDDNIGSWMGATTPTVGQKTMAASIPVVIPSDQSAIPVTAASLPLPTGAATETSLVAQSLVDNAPFTDGTSRVVPAGYVFDEVAGTALTENDIAAARLDSKRAIVNVIEDATTRGRRVTVLAASTTPVAADIAMAVAISPNNPMSLVDNAAFTDGTTRVTPAGFIFDDVAGTALTENDAAASRIDSKRAQVLVIEDATTRGTRSAVKAASTAAVAADPALVVAISPNNTVVTREVGASTGTTTSVAASAANVTLLAANANRLNASIRNDSVSASLYVKFGATASATSHKVLLAPGAYFEFPGPRIYTGIVDGIWTAAVGSARISEET